jgi:hypothetical protein
MLVVFKSAASADLLYFGDVAKLVLELMGKEASDRGVVTVEQLPEAIARLEAAIVGDRPLHREHLLADATKETDPDGNERPHVSLTRRALPLLEMLRESLKEKEPVVWGV